MKLPRFTHWIVALRIKRLLSGLRQLLTSENSLNNDEKNFLFHVKSFFRSWDICMFSWLFGFLEKPLDKKVKVNFKIYDVLDWTANIYNTHITQYLKT